MKIISGLVLLLAISLTFGGLSFSGINYAEASGHEVILGGTGVDDDADMHFIDPNTGLEIEFIGELTINGRGTDISAIDVDSTGRIFAAGSGAGSGPLVEIILVPELFAIPQPGFAFSTCNGMSFAPDDTLYCFDNRRGGLHIIDIAAGTKTLLGPTGLGSTSGNGLAIDGDGTIFHGTRTGLNTLDPVTGAALTSVPWTFPPELEGLSCKANGMDFSSEGILYADMDCRDNEIVTIDTVTGHVTLVGTTVKWLDAITFVSGDGIPEPPQPGSIHGMKWNDANVNGILDGAEQGVPGVEICLFLNEGFEGEEFFQDVAFDDTFGIQIAEANIGPIGGFEEIACTLTDDNGQYWFENLQPGFYIVEEFIVDQIQVFPDRDYIEEFGECPFFFESSCLELLDFFPHDIENPSIPHFIEVASGEIVNDVNFGNVPAAFLHGMKWNDANEDGIHDAGEVGAPGIEVLLFKLTHPDIQGELVDSTFTMFDDLTTPENEDGLYWFTVAPGTYRIVEVLPDGSSQTFPAASAPHYVDVESGDVISNLDFGNTAALPGSIQGIKFSDDNRNGIRDINEITGLIESGVPNVTFCLSPAGTCTQTDANGEFSFILSPGEYIVSETVPSNSVNTTPIVVSATVTSGAETLVSFGNTSPIPPPSEVTISPLNTWGSGGLPSVYWQNNITISKDTGPTGFDHCGDDSPISVDLQLDFTETATVELIPMDLVGPGDVYSTTLAPFFPVHGLLNLTFLVECPGNLNPDGADEIQVGGSIYIDPSGQITDACTDLPIEGAKVTLFKEYPPTGEFFIAEETDYIEDTGSVQTTESDGRYAWNTVAGNYKVSASAAGFITQESPIVPIPPPVLDLDVALEREDGCQTDPVLVEHFMSYKAKDVKGTEKFDKFTVTLSDSFEANQEFKVEKPERLFNPIDKNGEGLIDEISHMVGYKIKEPKGDKFEKITGLIVSNQFGDITLDIKKPKLLLVPSAKDHFAVPAQLNPVTIDHFTCYDVKETKHTPKFVKQIATVHDPNFEITTDYEIKKPKLLCIPAEKIHNGVTTEITSPDENLLCYDAKKDKGEPKFEKLNVFTNNQFGSDELKIDKAEDLCVPSTYSFGGLPDDESGGL